MLGDEAVRDADLVTEFDVKTASFETTAMGTHPYRPQVSLQVSCANPCLQLSS